MVQYRKNVLFEQVVNYKSGVWLSMGAGRPKKYFQFIDEEYKNKYIEQYKDKKDASGVKSALKIIDVVECLYGKPFYEINNEAIISALRKIQSSGSVDKFFTIINDYNSKNYILQVNNYVNNTWKK